MMPSGKRDMIMAKATGLIVILFYCLMSLQPESYRYLLTYCSTCMYSVFFMGFPVSSFVFICLCLTVKSVDLVVQPVAHDSFLILAGKGMCSMHSRDTHNMYQYSITRRSLWDTILSSVTM